MTHRENVRRGNASARKKAITHCPRKHLYDEQNTGRGPTGRYCKTCKNDKERAKYDPAKRSARYQAKRTRSTSIAPSIT